MSGLAGHRVVVTRTRERASGLVDLLQERGAVAIVVPLIATEPIAAPRDVAGAAAELAAAPAPRWVAFTSATAVRLVVGALGELPPGTRVAAVGAETAAALRACGVQAEVVASEWDAAGLARTMAAAGVRGATVWLPCAEGARAALPEGLRAAGATVRVQPVYRSVMPADAPRRLAAALDTGIDAVTLTSGSTARHLVRALGPRALPAGVVVACIGPQTASDARGCGLGVSVVAAEPSARGLVAALEGVWPVSD